MTISAIFKSTFPSMNYVFKNGMTAVFIGGKYVTDNLELAHELMQEVKEIGKTKSKHPYIYVDEEEMEIDSEALTPIEIIKQEAYAQAMADIKRAMANEPSISDQGKFSDSVANTTNIAGASASDSGGPANMSATQLVSASKMAATAKAST
jgi:hypothetical protein